MELFSVKSRKKLMLIIFVMAFLIDFFTISPMLIDTLLGQLLSYLGIILIVVGIFGRLYSYLFIGGNKNKELVRRGIYRRTRNPLYFFNFIITLGFGFSSSNFIVMSLLIISFIIYFPGVILKEERNLKKLFPHKFPEYKRKVPMFFPILNKIKTKRRLKVSILHFRFALNDAIWFIVAYSVLRFIVFLHRNNYTYIIYKL